MRKFCVMVLVMMFVFVFTQYVYPGGFGIKGGVNFARVYGSDILFFDFDNRIGGIFGVFYSFDLGKRFAIQPEVYYSMKGAKISADLSLLNVTGKYDIKIDYLEIPLLLKFKIPTKGKLKFNLFVGPFAAFKVSAKGTAEVEIAGVKETEDMNMVDVTSTDFGITFGTSLDIKMGSGSLIIDARYSAGCREISIYSTTLEVTSRNSALSLMLGYEF